MIKSNALTDKDDLAIFKDYNIRSIYDEKADTHCYEIEISTRNGSIDKCKD
jgi:hypothetical protein